MNSSRKQRVAKSAGISPSARAASQALRRVASPQKARLLAGYFKTGPGGYAEGDRFLGVMVPQTRSVAREFRDLPHSETLKLLRSSFHEERLLALLIWVDRFERGGAEERERIRGAYLANTKHINNWDLIDLTAPRILGPFLRNPRSGMSGRMRKFIRSNSLWERRIALLSTFHLFNHGSFALFLEFAERVLKDDEDLIHKASGWGLREAGKRDMEVLLGFLKDHGNRMPRTMLRYAIERLPKVERMQWLKETRTGS